MQLIKIYSFDSSTDKGGLQVFHKHKPRQGSQGSVAFEMNDSLSLVKLDGGGRKDRSTTDRQIP